jgi:hypothetical protein
MIKKSLELLSNLESSIKKIRAVNINRDSIKTFAIETASYYFNHTRPTIVNNQGETDVIRKYDSHWQQLIRLAHGNNPKSSYLRIIKILKDLSKELSIATISQVPIRKENPYAETLLIKTLEEIIPSAAQSYKQGLEDLNQTDRVSFRGTACEFRETLRDLLDHLAPDAEIIKEPGFKFEKDQTRPTMKQRVRFILKSRGKGEKTRTLVEKSIDFIENLFGGITRAFYDRASISTHVQTTKEEVLQLKRYLDVILFDLLEITEGKSAS